MSGTSAATRWTRAGSAAVSPWEGFDAIIGRPPPARRPRDRPVHRPAGRPRRDRQAYAVEVQRAAHRLDGARAGAGRSFRRTPCADAGRRHRGPRGARAPSARSSSPSSTVVSRVVQHASVHPVRGERPRGGALRPGARPAAARAGAAGLRRRGRPPRRPCPGPATARSPPACATAPPRAPPTRSGGSRSPRDRRAAIPT